MSHQTFQRAFKRAVDAASVTNATTMIYAHLLKVSGHAVRSPLDGGCLASALTVVSR